MSKNRQRYAWSHDPSPNSYVPLTVDADIAIRCAALQAAATIVAASDQPAGYDDILNRIEGIALRFEAHLRGEK